MAVSSDRPRGGCRPGGRGRTRRPVAAGGAALSQPAGEADRQARGETEEARRRRMARAPFPERGLVRGESVMLADGPIPPVAPRATARVVDAHVGGSVASAPTHEPPPPGSLLHDVLTSRVYDVARETPLDPAPRLSRRLVDRGPPQARGPAARLQLQAARRLQQDRAPDARRSARRGVIAASAGNHAQGVALLGPAPRAARGHRDAADDARDQGRGGAGAGRGGRARRRQLLRRQGPLRRARGRDRPRRSSIPSTTRW